MNRTTQLGIVAFVAVFVLVVAAAGISGVFAPADPEPAEAAPSVPEIDNPQYDAGLVSADSTPGSADVEVDSAAFDSNVVIHAGTVTERDLAPLVNALTQDGHDVTVVEAAGAAPPIDPGLPLISDGEVGQAAPPPDDPGAATGLAADLEDAHGFISVGVAGYTDADVEAIEEFVEDDGRVMMAVDPAQEFDFGGGNSEVYNALGVYTESGYVYNLEENDLNYQRIFTEAAGGSELTEGVDRAVFDTATPVQAVTEEEAMVPIEGSELSTTREETDDPVLVRDGNVAFVGDTGFMNPENVQRADNDVLVGNIGEWLTEADRAVDDTDEPPTDENDENDEETETVTVAVGPDGENRFDPEFVEIEPGTTVEFVWESDGHNIVPLFAEPEEWMEEFGVEEPQEEGFTYEFTFEEEGFVEFVSESDEQQMFGAVVVGEPGP